MVEKHPRRAPDRSGSITRRDHIPPFSNTLARPAEVSTSADEREQLTYDARDALLASLPAGGLERFLATFDRALSRDVPEDEAWRIAWIDVQEYYGDPKDVRPDEVPPHMEE